MSEILKAALEQIVNTSPIEGNWYNTSEQLKGIARNALAADNVEILRYKAKKIALKTSKERNKKLQARIAILKQKIIQLEEFTKPEKREYKARLGQNTEEMKRYLNDIFQMAGAPNPDKIWLLASIEREAANALELLERGV